MNATVTISVVLDGNAPTISATIGDLLARLANHIRVFVIPFLDGFLSGLLITITHSPALEPHSSSMPGENFST